MTDEDAVLAANAAFYKAFLTRDLAAMELLWADDGVSCIHPGWTALIGRESVLASWRNILGNAEQSPIHFGAAEALVAGDEGRVVCVELIDATVFAATNLFHRINGVWRMVHHHASPIAQPESEPVESAPPGRLH
jgi:ketosteroid isomerase-like protein